MVRFLSTLSLLALAAACGSPERRDFDVQGMGVVIDSRAPFATSPDLPARLESTVAVALGYWGGGWDDLAGLTVTLTDAPSVPCGGAASLGCTEGDEMKVVTADPGAGTVACVEQTVLVHEIGHAVLGDPWHTDPRWMGFDAVAEQLAGRVGYTPDGDAECLIYPSVWRHPLEAR